MQFVRLGIDVGNGFCKFRNKLFRSRVMVGELSKASERNESEYEVEYDGLTYIVGSGSEFITSKRHLKEEYLLCMLTAVVEEYEEIYKNADKDKIKDNDIVAILCIGVPVETFQRKEYMEQIKEKYNNNKTYSIKVNGNKYKIRLHKCAVITESAYPLYSEETNDVVVIDVGTGTISAVHWRNRKIVSNEYRTYPEGLYVMANKITKVLKNYYKEDISVEHILANLGKNEIMINQTNQDFTFHKKLMGQHITAVASRIMTDFRLSEVEKIYIQGGGAEETIEYWKDDFENAIAVPDGQFINAKVYQKYADVL